VTVIAGYFPGGRPSCLAQPWRGSPAASRLSALLRVSHVSCDALRFAGAGYLIWLGARSLGLLRRGRTRPAAATAPSAPAHRGLSTADWGRVYAKGLLCNVLNPKIGVFFVALLTASRWRHPVTPSRWRNRSRHAAGGTRSRILMAAAGRPLGPSPGRPRAGAFPCGGCPLVACCRI
jgi:LysE type translocator